MGGQEDKEGVSVILARTEKGRKVIENACRAGVIQVEAIDPGSVFKGQHIEAKRRDWTAFTAVWQKSGNKPPDFNISPQWHAACEDRDFAVSCKAIERALKLTRVLSRNQLLRTARRQYILDRIQKRIVSYITKIKKVFI